jgi:hypothetical protein
MTPAGWPPSRRSIILTIAGALAAGGAIWAALEAHKAWLRPDAQTHPMAATHDAADPMIAATRPQDYAVSDRLMASELRGVLSPFDGDPLDVPPPPQSRRLRGYQRRAQGMLQQQAIYQNLSASMAELADYYRNALSEKGLGVIRHGGDDVRHELLAAGRDVTAQVVLRRQRPASKIVEVTLVVTRTGAVNDTQRTGTSK